jgi:hypothetical protein
LFKFFLSPIQRPRIKNVQIKLHQSPQTEVVETEVLRTELIPTRVMIRHEGEENCILRKFVTGKPNNDMKKSVKDKTDKTHDTQDNILRVNSQSVEKPEVNGPRQ